MIPQQSFLLSDTSDSSILPTATRQSNIIRRMPPQSWPTAVQQSVVLWNTYSFIERRLRRRRYRRNRSFCSLLDRSNHLQKYLSFRQISETDEAPSLIGVDHSEIVIAFDDIFRHQSFVTSCPKDNSVW